MEPKTHSPSFASRNFRAFMTDLLKGMDDVIYEEFLSCLLLSILVILFVAELLVQDLSHSNRALRSNK